jgi:hypothetical protein
MKLSWSDPPSLGGSLDRLGRSVCVALIGFSGALFPMPAFAIEGGFSTRAPGSQGPLAGILPGPGTYGTNSLYYYTGDAGRLPRNGRIELEVEVDALLDVLQVTHITSINLFGASVGFGAALPIGYVSLESRILEPSQTFQADSDDFDVGDLVLTPLVLGWHSGSLHWTGSLSVVVPLGTYEASKTINVSLNRYAIDPTVGVTWLNPRTGLEVSGALGYTVSFENDETDYDSGDEVHFEAAVAQHFPSGLALGLAGYGVWQVTGDSGTGAVLGDFKGRAIGLGPMASYNFDVADYKFSASARYYHEFAVAKRFEGDTSFLQVSFKF